LSRTLGGGSDSRRLWSVKRGVSSSSTKMDAGLIDCQEEFESDETCRDIGYRSRRKSFKKKHRGFAEKKKPERNNIHLGDPGGVRAVPSENYMS